MQHSIRVFALAAVVAAGVAAAAPAATGLEAQNAEPRVAEIDDDSLPDPRLVRRWAELFAVILERYEADGIDPVGNVEADFSTRELRIRAGGSEWARRVVSMDQLESGDIERIARQIYRQARSRNG